MVSIIMILSSLVQSNNIFEIINREEFKFEVEFPNKSILESQSNALAIFISTGKLSLVFAFSILLMWVTDTPESSASFS